ncbi:MAG TPA: ABC transporter ATP-binding protein [Mycobacteriales bacterium]|jgi:branched-chain amino acid transport system ATP-binding protein|nr:ABC transporter ATP-binding protein [Mycobacteriales bacterium]
MAEPLLDAAAITIRFGGLVALNEVDLQVAASGITGLIGPNGAGKTTLFNVITGLLEPSSGMVRYDGQDINRWSPPRRGRAGIARTFQRLDLFVGMSVRDNLRAAYEANLPGGVLGRRSREGVELVDALIERLDMRDIADRRAGTLSTGLGRMVELGRALSTRPRLLLLDEPSSGLDVGETEHFRDLLLEITQSEFLGRPAPAVLLVEHDVQLVMEVCQQITVLEFGQRIAHGTPQAIRSDPAVVAAYLGESAA